MFDYKKQPKFGLKDLVGSLMISFGMILFLTSLHILTINSFGDTQSVMNTTFNTTLRIAIALMITVFVFLVIYFLRVLVYIVSTPKWYREERKNG